MEPQIDYVNMYVETADLDVRSFRVAVQNEGDLQRSHVLQLFGVNAEKFFHWPRGKELEFFKQFFKTLLLWNGWSDFKIISLGNPF